MTAFKIKDTPIYRIEPSIDGVGRLPRMSTGTRDRKIAEQMEAMLVQLAGSGYTDLVIQLRDGHVRLSEIWQAHMQPPDRRKTALDGLQSRRGDPLLSETVADRLPAVRDARVKEGYAQLLALVEEGARLSRLTEPNNVTDLYEKALATRKPNSVRRSLHRAVSDLLTRRFSRGKMMGIMADVDVPGENDERKVNLSPDEIQKALEAADPVFANAIGFALTSGIDQGPMCALLVRDLADDDVLHIADTKTPYRDRRFKLDPDAARYFRLAAAGKDADERVFAWTKKQVETRWAQVRKAIKRTDVRWKDLRGVFATYFLEAGGSPRELQLIMGHSTLSMTLRYVRRMAVRGDTAVGNAMGLGKQRLTVEKGGAGA